VIVSAYGAIVTDYWCFCSTLQHYMKGGSNMPLGDKTGPYGAGPMSGRGAGYCAGYNMPGYANPAGRFGAFGFGRGFGGRVRGFRHWFYATGLPGWLRSGWDAPTPYQYSREDERLFLKQQFEYLSKTIENISKRLSELEKEE